MRNTIRTVCLATVVNALCIPLVFAQATRTWVSGVGDDVNPCSRTAPCKTFAGAISKTATGGEIDVIDPGGFGAVTITKSMTIDGNGPHASILAAGTSGVIINAPGAVVNLRNLSINGVSLSASPGLSGIRILAAAQVNVENCVIAGFTQRGINVETSSDCRLNVKDSIIRNCGLGAIHAQPTAASVTATIRTTSLLSSSFGFRGEGGVKAILDDCVIAGNVSNGVILVANSVGGLLSVNRSTISDTTGAGAGNGNGVVCSGAFANVRISDCTIFNNIVGVLVSGGSAFSANNNRIRGNATDVSGPLQSAFQQ